MYTADCNQTPVIVQLTQDGTIGRPNGQTDGVSVSFEYTNNVVIVASASIAWNIADSKL